MELISLFVILPVIYIQICLHQIITKSWHTSPLPILLLLFGILILFTIQQIVVNLQYSPLMKKTLITKEDTASNPNSQYGINTDVQLLMANGNTQFLLQLAREFKYGFSIPSIALQIAAKFFHQKCYINYDRFIILVGCLMIAAKFKDMEVGLKKLCFCTYNVLSRRLGHTKPYDENEGGRLREQICIAESEVLRVLEFDIDCSNPHEYARRYSDMCFGGIGSKRMNDYSRDYSKVIYETVRILIFDSNRRQCSLYFSPLTIFIACFMITSHYQNLKPFAYLKKEQQLSQSTDQELYKVWLQRISDQEGEELKQEAILACIKQLNAIIGIASP